MEIQGASSSSNDVNQKVTISEEAKEEEPENKKVKQNEFENTKETQDETIGTSINDLPTEMLITLLKYVDDYNLMPCRLVNRKWLELSTEIVHKRGGVEIQFKCDDMEWFYIAQNEGRLEDFVQCFNESKTLPYSSFLFRFDTDAYGCKDWNIFLSKFGETIKCLKLVIERGYDVWDLVFKLRDLLLIKIPHLEEFGLTFSSKPISPLPMKFFPSKTMTKSAKGKPREIDAPPVQLPHLKVLHLSEILFTKCPGIVDDLLKAAVNLTSIQDFGEYHSKGKKYFKTEDYIFLHSRGKLDLLEEAEMTPSTELFSAFEGKTHEFKLGYLELCLSEIYKGKENWTDASTFFSHLFENNKETLTELTMDPLGFLPDVKLPRFTKLETLIVKPTNYSEMFEPVFPCGINSMDIFPALCTLDFDVDWTRCFPGEDNVPRLPSVENLRVYDYKLTGNCIFKMSLMCPNLQYFKISCSYDDKYKVNFPEVARAIWTHMKKIKSLEVCISLNSDFNTSHALDSCFTGFSVENCKRLFELMKANEYLKRWNSQGNIPKAEFETPERESASILDLKDLTELRVELYWNVGNRKSTEDLLETALTCVSETYAFKLMENLYYSLEQNVQY